LIETMNGVDRIDELAMLPGVDELHLGINDLSLSLGLANRFAVLLHEATEAVAAASRAAHKPLGVAHIGRARDDQLPVPADLVYAQLARLGATGTLLGRSFLYGGTADLAANVVGARLRLSEWWSAGSEAWDAARLELARRTHAPLPHAS
jgi:hypothetical protein